MYKSACSLTLDLVAKTRAFSRKCPCYPSRKTQDSFWGGEQDGSWLFSKGISLAWPSWAGPSFEWLTLYLFCPYNNRISQAPQRPFTLVLSQITRLTFPLLVSVAWKKIPRLFTQSQEAMLRYVCCDKTSDGRQIWEGQWWSRTHTHRNTHSLCPESRSRSNIILKLLMLKKPLNHDIYCLNTVCNWSVIKSRWGDKGFTHSFLLSHCVWTQWHFLIDQLCAGAPYCLPYTFLSAESKQGKICKCEHTNTYTWAWA